MTPDYNLPQNEDLSMQGSPYLYRAYVRSGYQSSNPMEDGNPAFRCEDFFVERLSDQPDALEYAVYKRNREIEENFKVSIRQTPQNGNMVAELKQFYQNGEAYDLTVIFAKSAAQAATQNLLKDMQAMEYVDLTHEAYDQNSVRELSMGGKLYYLSGDMNISAMDSIAPTVINLPLYEKHKDAIIQEFANDASFADIYTVVANKKWTMDALLRIAQIVNVDAETSDGVLDVSKGDVLGYFQYMESPLYYFFGAGGRITQMGEDGYPAFAIQTNENQELFNYIYNHFNKSKASWMPNGNSKVRTANFYTGNCLLTEMNFFEIRKKLYHEASFEYGVLPNPVFHEGDDYRALVYFYNVTHLWAIPSLTADSYRSQLMLQAMAAYSCVNRKESTMEAYYTRTLYLTASGPNPGSRRAMETIRHSMVYDIAALYNWGGWVDTLKSIDDAPTNQYASFVGMMSQYAIPQMKATIDSFKNPTALPSR